MQNLEVRAEFSSGPESAEQGFEVRAAVSSGPECDDLVSPPPLLPPSSFRRDVVFIDRHAVVRRRGS